MEQQPKKPASQTKVLLAEDSQSMRMIIKSMLRDMGFTQIAEAGDGNQAIQLIDNEAWDLILCDWQMPSANGIDALKAARESASNQTSVFIMCTGNSDLTSVKEAIDAQVTDYLAKPISQDSLKAKLIQYFNLN
jgi:two-component system chemotaxis response regulator CheY